LFDILRGDVIWDNHRCRSCTADRQKGLSNQELLRSTPLDTFNVIIIGAGAAGLMCAIEAGKRGRSVLVLEHNEKIAEKILISGGGRCNFTNLSAGPDNFLS
jgi:threonine dehydrogenase-like Zn-dependent dehydrogenase